MEEEMNLDRSYISRLFRALQVLLEIILLSSIPAQAQQVIGAGSGAVAEPRLHGVPGSPDSTKTIDGRYLPQPPQRFGGEINLNAAQIEAVLARPRRTPEGSAQYFVDHDGRCRFRRALALWRLTDASGADYRA
jgi:hypothetical protein